MKTFVLRAGLFGIGFLCGIWALMLYRPSESELEKARMEARAEYARDVDRLMADPPRRLNRFETGAIIAPQRVRIAEPQRVHVQKFGVTVEPAKGRK